MKLEFSIRNLLLTAALLALAGCAVAPLTPEQKALNKAYDAISSGKAGSSIKK
ncbi:MAG: hypothetical protein WC825_04525 [Gallionellaceae bacterium]|jgi:hypothetical protein